MHFLRHKPIRRIAVPLFLLLFLLQGCTVKPWYKPLDDADSLTFLTIPETVRKQQSSCTPCLDAGATFRLDSAVGERSLAGYLLVMQPDHLKFIIHNPLNQPILAFSGNRQEYQYLNTFERTLLKGQPDRLVKEVDIPEIFGSGDWGSWLLGFVPNKPVTAVRRDRGSKGLWFDYEKESTGKQEHIRIDEQTNRVTGRIITRNKDVVLKITYLQYNETTDHGCSLPDRMLISGFDLSTTIEVTLSDPQHFATCSRQDFNLPSPTGYTVRNILSANH